MSPTIVDAGNRKVMAVLYTNWRGETRLRRLLPHPDTMRFGRTEYHPILQWLFDATDCDDVSGKVKTFAMSGIQGWYASADQSKAWR